MHAGKKSIMSNIFLKINKLDLIHSGQYWFDNFKNDHLNFSNFQIISHLFFPSTLLITLNKLVYMKSKMAV